MFYRSSVCNYFCFSLIVYATVLVVLFLIQVPKGEATVWESKRPSSVHVSVDTMVKL